MGISKLEDVRNGLNTRQWRFVNSILDGTGLEASAIKAGYKKTSARTSAWALMKMPAIAAAIEEGRKLALRSAVISVADVVQQYARMAFLDLKEMLDAEGEVKPLAEMSETMRKTIIGLKKTTRYLKNGDKLTRWEYNFESRKGALDSLSEIAGLTKRKDSLDDPGKIIESITDLVKAAQKYNEKEIKGIEIKTIDALPDKQ